MRIVIAVVIFLAVIVSAVQAQAGCGLPQCVMQPPPVIVQMPQYRPSPMPPPQYHPQQMVPQQQVVPQRQVMPQQQIQQRPALPQYQQQQTLQRQVLPQQQMQRQPIVQPQQIQRIVPQYRRLQQLPRLQARQMVHVRQAHRTQMIRVWSRPGLIQENTVWFADEQVMYTYTIPDGSTFVEDGITYYGFVCFADPMDQEMICVKMDSRYESMIYPGLTSGDPEGIRNALALVFGSAISQGLIDSEYDENNPGD